MDQVSQSEGKTRSPFKRRAGLSDEEMGTLHLHCMLLECKSLNGCFGCTVREL